jgi:Toprim-like
MSDAALIIDTINEINASLGMPGLVPAKDVKNTYVGPCPLCKREGRAVNGGHDRVTVKIDRPALGNGSRYNPVFWCRRCPTNELDYGWSGDIIQYIRDTTDKTYVQALEMLGIDPMTYGSQGKRVLNLAFRMQGLTPHNAKWVQSGNKFIQECIDRLWNPEYIDCLDYLRTERGFTDDILRRAMVGWNEDDYYVDAETWGMGKGRMHIHSGFVYPEYHLEKDELVLYSIAIRRIQSDLDDEFKLTGKLPSKTMVLADSQKSLYMMNKGNYKGKLCVLVEGQADALSVLQVNDGRFCTGATQGVTGARTTLADVLLWLSQTDGVLICFDGDDAGRTNTQYWKNILPYSMIWTPPTGKDPNKMLVDGSLQWFLNKGHELFYAAFPDRRAKSNADVAQTVVVTEVKQSEPGIVQSPVALISATKQEAPVTLQDNDSVIINGEVFKKQPAKKDSVEPAKVTPVVSGIQVQPKNSKGNKKSRTVVNLTGDEVNIKAFWSQEKPKVEETVPVVAQVVKEEEELTEEEEELTEADVDAQVERVFREGCIRCGGEIDSIDWVFNHATGLCAEYPNCEALIENRCKRCPAKIHIGGWCLHHYHSYRLLSLASQVSYRGFYVEPSMDYSPFGSGKETVVSPFMVKGGKERHEEFALNGPEAQVWAASIELFHAVHFNAELKSSAPLPPPINPHPCARIGAGCTKDYTRKHQIGDSERWDSNLKCMVPAKTATIGGVEVDIAGQKYKFCYHCADAGRWLAIGQELGFPEMYKVPAGLQAWRQKALNSDDMFYFTMEADTMLRKHRELDLKMEWI